MVYLLFTFYLACCTYLITRIPFIRKAGLSTALITGLFLIKVFAGIAIGWISEKYYPGNDYWGSNTDGLLEYDLLMNNPKEFFLSIFRSPYQHGYSGFFNAIGSYWNDLRDNIILKLLGICDIFSRGNYYINSLFFNFFGFLGPIGLFRVFHNIYDKKKWIIIIGCFLLPSTLYFSSGIHKDLIVFTLLGIFCYALYFSITKSMSVRRGMVLFISFALLTLFRNFVVIALVPVIIGFFISSKKRIHPLVAYAGTYLVLIFIIRAATLITPTFQPLTIITQRQQDFLNLPIASTQIPLTKLDSNLWSFMKNAPEAFNHGFLRPYITETHGSYLLPLAIELLFYELLFFAVILTGKGKILARNPFFIFCLLFGISMLLFTGYIIPNIGSIVRYKSIYLPFLLTPILLSLFSKSKII